jgi:hypothetical protein
MAACGTGSGASAGFSSRNDVRCHAPTVSVKISGIGASARWHAASVKPSAQRKKRDVISHDATIALMGKFKLAGSKGKKSARPQGAAGCVILILLTMVGVMVFLYLVMKSANG